MRHSTFDNLKPSRLRKLMWLFFFALALPTALLVYKSYDQLKWEAFYQHRVLAEELSNQIDQKFSDVIRAEQRRAFSDYRFATNDANNNNVIQRSPLSALPMQNAPKGVVGYFQIDANGEFSTPFLPTPLNTQTQYGLSPAEQEQRQAIQDQIESILSSNQLVEKQLALESNAELSRQPTTSLLGSSDNSSTRSLVQNQAAFDRLSESKISAPVKAQTKKDKSSVLSRLEELEISSPYKEKVGQRKSIEKAQKKRSIETLDDAFLNKSEFEADSDTAASLEQSRALAPPNIKLFENDIDPFEISLLNSGHFVLYRKVWRDEQRYIQGVLLQQDMVLDGLIRDSFRNSLLFSMSNLTVIYQGNALASFSQQSRLYSRTGRSSALEGTLLLRTRLSAPFDQLEAIFTVRRLPAGAGGKVVLWSALLMMLILILVIYSLYRLSLRNLSLVNQQQDFVSAVSHELKTPLTSIRMYGEILQAGWADEEKKKSYYRYIFDESERLTRLINNVLELARMTRNETPVTLQVIRVAELMDIIQSKIDSQIERAQFTLNMTIDEEAAAQKLNIDQDVFAQIVINLVDNAIKFSNKAECKVIEFHAQRRSNGALCFSIRDYGPGIAEDQLKKIFTLFYRAENELTRNTTGTGIGLALVSQLTQLMHGKIDVINRDPGAEFQLFFECVNS